MPELEDSVWSRGGGDGVLLTDDSDTSSDPGEENDDDLDLTTLVSQTPAAKAQSTTLNSTLDRLSHEYHLKQLELSQREDSAAIVKTNPFTKAKQLAVERARKASLPPDPVQAPPSQQGPPRRRGNLACAVVDPDRKEPTPPPPAKRAPSPYRRKPKGWTDARGEAIPSTKVASKGKRGAKGKQGGKTRDENGGGPSKTKGKAGGRGKAQKDNSSITFQRLPANLSADSPLVQGFQIQRTLPLKSTKPKAAPFPMTGRSGFQAPQRLDIHKLIDGTAEEARKEMQAQQAQKVKTTPTRGREDTSGSLDREQVSFEGPYDDPPTMTHASINSSSMPDMSLSSSSDIPYSSPLGRKGDNVPLQAPQPIRARTEMSHAERLEQALHSYQGPKTYRPNVTLYVAPPIPSQEDGWSTLPPPKPSRWEAQATPDRSKWPSNVELPLPPFKKSRASNTSPVPNPPSKAYLISSRPLFKPSPPKPSQHQEAPGYALSATNGSRYGAQWTTSTYFRVEPPTIKTASVMPGWRGDPRGRPEPEGYAETVEQSPFARRLREDRADGQRQSSIVFGNHRAPWTDMQQPQETHLVTQAPHPSNQRSASPEQIDHPTQRVPLVGQKRQAEDDEDSEDGWGKAYPPRSYRSPTHESTMYEPGPSSQQTPRKKLSTANLLERFAHTPARTPRAPVQGSGQAFGRFY